MSFGNYTESPSPQTSAPAESCRPALSRGNGAEAKEGRKEEEEKDISKAESGINEISRTCSPKAGLKRKKSCLNSAPKTGGEKKSAGVSVRGGGVKKSSIKKSKGA